jgi:hypothetical protein
MYALPSKDNPAPKATTHNMTNPTPITFADRSDISFPSKLPD